MPHVKNLIEGITREFIAVAAMEGVDMSFEDAMKANDAIFKSMPTQKSSTAQDLARKRVTEIDYLNGYIVECAMKRGLPAPYNQAVHALVKMIESKQ